MYLRSGMSFLDVSPFRHVCLWSGLLVSDQTCRSSNRHVGLRSGMSVSDQACESPIRHVGLWLNRSISSIEFPNMLDPNRYPILIVIQFSWAPKTDVYCNILSIIINSLDFNIYSLSFKKHFQTSSVEMFYWFLLKYLLDMIKFQVLEPLRGTI